MLTLSGANVAVVLASVLLMSQTSIRLNESVSAFWGHVVNNDQSQALEHVERDSKNNFLARRGSVIRSWKLKGTEFEGETTALVTVEVETFSGSGFKPERVTNEWVLHEGAWKIVFPKALETFRSLFEAQEAPLPEKATLEVFPEQVRIHLLNRSQVGVIEISNGSEIPVTSIELLFSVEGFELEQMPVFVPPRSSRLIRFRYLGRSSPKNRECSTYLKVSHGGDEKEFAIPTVVNFVSPGARGLLGLTEEGLKQLKAGDNPLPEISPGQLKNRAKTNRSIGGYGVDEE